LTDKTNTESIEKQLGKQPKDVAFFIFLSPLNRMNEQIVILQLAFRIFYFVGFTYRRKFYPDRKHRARVSLLCL
jgi:hypothetical protein